MHVCGVCVELLNVTPDLETKWRSLSSPRQPVFPDDREKPSFAGEYLYLVFRELLLTFSPETGVRMASAVSL